MTTLFAQPYDLSADGFTFDSAEEFAAKAAALRNDYGEIVEEFEIQFHDGASIDAALAKAWQLYQSTVRAFLEAVDTWDDHEKTRFIIAVGECGYSFDPETVALDDFDVDIYPVDSLKALAEQFVDEGLFGDIPERLQFYIDHDAIARDLSVDYALTEIAGTRLAYRCG